jgi:hypothetical protein
VAARRAHNPKVAGSNPAPATKDTDPSHLREGLVAFNHRGFPLDQDQGGFRKSRLNLSTNHLVRRGWNPGDPSGSVAFQHAISFHSLYLHAPRQSGSDDAGMCLTAPAWLLI